MPTPKKTDFEHFLSGTKSQAKPDAEALPPGRPRFPKDLSKDARPVFKNLVRLLEERRHCTSGDMYLCELFAELYCRRRRALVKIAEQGEICTYTRLDSNGNAHEVEKPNLWLKVAETSEKNMVACLDRLGLTPMNRSKLKPTVKPTTAPVDPEQIAAEQF